MPPRTTRILTKQEKLEEELIRKPAREFTKKQLFLYLFYDFFRASYIVGALFLDGVVIAELYIIIPNLYLYNALVNSVTGSFYLVYFYVALLTVFAEYIVIILEIKAYRKFIKIINPKIKV